MSTVRKCSFGYLNSSIQKSKTLGRSLASMLIVTSEESPKAALHGAEPKSDVNRLSGISPYDRAEIELNVLTPNGLLLVLNVNRTATLKQIKEVRRRAKPDLWPPGLTRIFFSLFHD